MSDTDHNASASDGDHLAAEYALGVLDAAGRREAERRIARDPLFAREVAFWEARLTPLADGVAPVEPPAHLWGEVEQRLDFGARVRPGAATAEPAGIWQKLAFWRGLEQRGHTIAQTLGQTSANSIMITSKGLIGAADPRTRGALAAGY